ncbi:hypothetical protein ONS95_007603 [Cadophora gregata]|uniref:uncharacterized protein n=1 Tax=Cadophora gregata TaxID=51156 RepID=UPI0026DACF44|nr:uncharacterized protein ONS95_007603 [Cadophora gregata]KAK0125980.1 hypothetical protein ONS95_007603 [Cadophora gregata]
MSTILCKAYARKFPNERTWCLKPVSTGPLDEADVRHVTRFSPESKMTYLFQIDEAVSPHIAPRSSRLSFLGLEILGLLSLFINSHHLTRKSKNYLVLGQLVWEQGMTFGALIMEVATPLQKFKVHMTYQE